MDELNILISADLNVNQSIPSINKSIEKLEKKINKLKLKATLDHGKSKTEIQKQIETLNKQRKKLYVDLQLRKDTLKKQYQELQRGNNFSINVDTVNAQKQLKNVFSICMQFIVFVSVTVFAVAFIFGSPLVRVFAEKGTPVYEIVRNGFLIFPFSFLFCGLNIFTSATFTALSNGKLSAILSFLRTFGLITVLLLTLPNLLGVTGVWLAVPIAELITMVVALVFLRQNREKYHYA